jgi:predicted solute-binding protein
MIRNEVSRYVSSPYTTQYFYQEFIEDFFLDRPDGKFEDMIQSLASEVGLSLKDARSYFPKARRDFDREHCRSRRTWPEYRLQQPQLPGLSAQTDESGQNVGEGKEIDESR